MNSIKDLSFMGKIKNWHTMEGYAEVPFQVYSATTAWYLHARCCPVICCAKIRWITADLRKPWASSQTGVFVCAVISKGRSAYWFSRILWLSWMFCRSSKPSPGMSSQELHLVGSRGSLHFSPRSFNHSLEILLTRSWRLGSLTLSLPFIKEV